ncbi:hypothetical protein DEO72_LG3g224 [Vigna unguiculata]|uniref:Uncharacterized protein n=1 Tax=Vigna unguiculata TaxID=3917 RepID=A0A4D6LBE5_VIGUN|nr:hypothetical protein DEO72_LG3g224 [Vigna unguiculata]
MISASFPQTSVCVHFFLICEGAHFPQNCVVGRAHDVLTGPEFGSNTLEEFYDVVIGVFLGGTEREVFNNVRLGYRLPSPDGESESESGSHARLGIATNVVAKAIVESSYRSGGSEPIVNNSEIQIQNEKMAKEGKVGNRRNNV